MSKILQGNILSAEADALVNTVNTVGIMGKGVALQFKRAFPENYKRYTEACERGEVQLGSVLVYSRGTLDRPKYIINFPTKGHWRSSSRLEDIESGLQDLVHKVAELDVNSIALPPLGCGNGGLEWEQVHTLIEQASEQLPHVEFMVYGPRDSEEPVTLAVSDTKPRLTFVGTALLKLFALYEALDGTIGRLEAQKLAYFLQLAGMDMKLQFVKWRYGPYADALNQMLKRYEGYYVDGFGDMSTGSDMRIKPGVESQADSLLAEHLEAQEFFERTERLIKGFETPYGMELLATVHWAATQEQTNNEFYFVLDAVQSWSKRKKYRFSESHIRAAWERLTDEGWVETPTVRV